MNVLKLPTQERLLQLFTYDPETGVLTRKEATKGYPGNRPITRKNHAGYIVTMVDGTTYRVHRLIWVMVHGDVENVIDHVNHDTGDNRLVNLRACNQHQNGGNKRSNRNRYKGITFCKYTSRWRAQISVRERHFCLGRYDTEEEAALAYNNAARLFFGEFACVSEVPCG